MDKIIAHEVVQGAGAAVFALRALEQRNAEIISVCCSGFKIIYPTGDSSPGTARSEAEFTIFFRRYLHG